MHRVIVRPAPPLIVSCEKPTVQSASDKCFSTVNQWATKFFSLIPPQSVLVSGVISYSLSSIVSLTLFSPDLPIRKLATNLSFLTMFPMSIGFGWFFGKAVVDIIKPTSPWSKGILDKATRILLLTFLSCFFSFTIVDILQTRSVALHRINANLSFLSGVLFARYFLSVKKQLQD